MKKTLILAALLAGSLTAGAQTLFDNENNHAYFGARIGLDVTSASDGHGIYSNGAGFHVGAVYNIPLYMNFYFEPGVSIFYNTFGQQVTTAWNEDVPGDVPFTVDGSIRNFGFRVPFNLGFRFDLTDEIGVSLYTGPVLNYSITAKEHWDKVGGEEIMDGGSLFGYRGFKHFDLQWDFGVGLSYQKYYLSVGGAVGVTKVFDNPVIDFRRNNFTIALGYNF